MKNENKLIEQGFKKINMSNYVEINLSFKDKYEKEILEIGADDESLLIKMPSILRVANTEENIETISKLNSLLLKLYNDEFCQKWFGNDKRNKIIQIL